MAADIGDEKSTSIPNAGGAESKSTSRALAASAASAVAAESRRSSRSRARSVRDSSIDDDCDMETRINTNIMAAIRRRN